MVDIPHTMNNPARILIVGPVLPPPSLPSRVTRNRSGLIVAAAVSALLGYGLMPAHADNPTNWKTFNSATVQAWSAGANWTSGTAPSASDPTMVVNFDPLQAGTSGSSITTNFTSTNDLGSFQLNALNLSGSSSSTATSRTVIITGGTLRFGGVSPTITNTTATNGSAVVNYTISSAVTLDSDLSINANGTGLTFLSGGITANTSGTKTITTSGAGNVTLGNTGGVIANGNGVVGITHAGPGLLTMGGTNTFTGDLLIRSGTVATSTSSSGNGFNLGTGNAVKIGDTGGAAANATLQLGNFTYGNFFTVQSGNAGSATIQNTGNANTALSNVLTVNKDVTLAVTGVGGSGAITLSGGLTGAGSVTVSNSGTGNVTIAGNNAGFTGNVNVTAGILRVTTTTALSAANTVSVDSANNATFNISGVNQTIAGLNNGTNGGGSVTNTGAARTLTLAGSGTYTFGGVISGTGAGTNMALTVSLGANGKQILTGANTYAGTTTLTVGTLLINGDNSGATGAVSINGGVLGGSGTIGGATTIANNATLAPGSSAGLLTFSNNLTFGGVDSKANFEIASGSLGTNYDGVNVGGLLTYNGDLTLTMTGLIADGTYNLFDFGSHTGSFDTVAFGGGSNPYSGSFVNDAGVWTATSGGQTFTFTQSTGDLVVAAVPEPSIWALAAAGGTVLVTLRRRRSGAR